MKRSIRCMALPLTLVLAAPVFAETETDSAGAQVEAAERDFAKTMAARDLDAFTSFLSKEAVFVAGPVVLRGPQQISAGWTPYFEGPEAPFSWEPALVEVLDSGSMALSTGPVRSADGTVVSSFTSIWRQEESGVWRVLFDHGNRVCPPAPEP